VWLTKVARSRSTKAGAGVIARLLGFVALLLPVRHRERFVGEVLAILADRPRWWQRVGELLSVAGAVPGLAVILRRARAISPTSCARSVSTTAHPPATRSSAGDVGDRTAGAHGDAGPGAGDRRRRLAQAVADATLLGPVYLAGDAGGVDEAVERLRRALDRGGREETAAAIAVLAQACEATAALIGNAAVLAAEEPGAGRDVDALLVRVLRWRAPLRLMRRLSPAREPVTLDLDAAGCEAAEPPLTFGSGLRPCPGADQAVALAAGVLDALLPRYDCNPEGVRWADLPALRLPERLECRLKQVNPD
jgi:hypothetical protein